MSIFTKSYARGVTDTLMRTGLAKFASVEQALEVADYVGEQFDVEPTAGSVPGEKVAALAVAVIELSQKLASGTGTLITGDNAAHKNTPEEAAKANPLAALDQANRPQGMYAKGEKGVGQTDFKAPAAAIIGSEQAHPKAPGVTDSKPNSVNTFGKAASLNELIRKLASGTGSLVTGDQADQSNTPAEAAKTSPTAALDEKSRPQGTYAKGESGVGQSDVKPAGAAIVGSEQPHDKAPGKTDAGSNSLTEHSKAAAYTARFEETAREYLPSLPAGMSDEEKVAAVKTLMGLDVEEARDFLAKSASAKKHASGLEEAKAALEEKKEEKSESKSEEKKEGFCTTCHKPVCECKKDEKSEEKKEEKVAAPHRRKYKDPYGYKGYDALAKGPGKEKAAALLANLGGLAKR